MFDRMYSRRRQMRDFFSPRSFWCGRSIHGSPAPRRASKPAASTSIALLEEVPRRIDGGEEQHVAVQLEPRPSIAQAVVRPLPSVERRQLGQHLGQRTDEHGHEREERGVHHPVHLLLGLHVVAVEVEEHEQHQLVRAVEELGHLDGKGVLQQRDLVLRADVGVARRHRVADHGPRAELLEAELLHLAADASEKAEVRPRQIRRVHRDAFALLEDHGDGLLRAGEVGHADEVDAVLIEVVHRADRISSARAAEDLQRRPADEEVFLAQGGGERNEAVADGLVQLLDGVPTERRHRREPRRGLLALFQRLV